MDFNQEAHEGSILLGYQEKRELISAVWIDTWHMTHQFMVCQGLFTETGAIMVTGSYAVDKGPD